MFGAEANAPCTASVGAFVSLIDKFSSDVEFDDTVDIVTPRDFCYTCNIYDFIRFMYICVMWLTDLHTCVKDSNVSCISDVFCRIIEYTEDIFPATFPETVSAISKINEIP